MIGLGIRLAPLSAQTGGAPPETFRLLLEDGVSVLLLETGTDALRTE